MRDYMTFRGFVATEITTSITSLGHSVARFRIGVNDRRFNKDTQQWKDGLTNWYSVSVFRSLADNIVGSISKGDRVIIYGKLKINRWEKDGSTYTNCEIDAESLGPDLTWGTCLYTRSSKIDKGFDSPAGFSTNIQESHGAAFDIDAQPSMHKEDTIEFNSDISQSTDKKTENKSDKDSAVLTHPVTITTLKKAAQSAHKKTKTSPDLHKKKTPRSESFHKKKPTDISKTSPHNALAA